MTAPLFTSAATPTACVVLNKWYSICIFICMVNYRHLYIKVSRMPFNCCLNSVGVISNYVGVSVHAETQS